MIERAGFSSAQRQHNMASSGALVISQGVLRASTCYLFPGSHTCRPPHPWAEVSLPHDGLFMLTYLSQFCNSSFVSLTPAWQGLEAHWRRRLSRPRWVAVAWRAMGLADPVLIWWSLQAVCRTPGRAPSTRRQHILPDAARFCTRSVDPTVCQPVQSPHRHTVSSAIYSSDGRCVPEYARLLRSDRPGAQGVMRSL